jgi:hypothetical protein
MAGDLFDNWFDPLEAEVRARSREFIEELRTFQERKSDGVTAKFGPARAVDSLNENLGNRGAPRQQNAWAESVAPFRAYRALAVGSEDGSGIETHREV